MTIVILSWFHFQFVAGFGKGGTSLPFWENVYGLDMSCVGKEINKEAARFPIVDVINSCDVVTSTAVLQVSVSYWSFYEHPYIAIIICLIM